MIKAKEKPIIFSTGLIPAIQNLKPNVWPPEPIDPGKPWKWQTRRIIKAPVLSEVRQPDEVIFDGNVCEFAWHGNDVAGGFKIKCPYPPGTRLWVKEAWAEISGEYIYKASDYESLWYCDNCERIVEPEEVTYTETHDLRQGGCGDYVGSLPLFKWRSPRFMPKAVARLWLAVKNVRVERVQEISNEDILAEGINDLGSYGANYDYFANEIWDNINAKRGYPWENNDWVWVYEFMRIE